MCGRHCPREASGLRRPMHHHPRGVVDRDAEIICELGSRNALGLILPARRPLPEVDLSTRRGRDRHRYHQVATARTRRSICIRARQKRPDSNAPACGAIVLSPSRFSIWYVVAIDGDDRQAAPCSRSAPRQRRHLHARRARARRRRQAQGPRSCRAPADRAGRPQVVGNLDAIRSTTLIVSASM